MGDKMFKKYISALIPTIGIIIIELVALFKGIDGKSLALSISGLSLIVGYFLREKKEVNDVKKEKKEKS